MYDAHVVQCVACKQKERKQQERKKPAQDKNATSSQTVTGQPLLVLQLLPLLPAIAA